MRDAEAWQFSPGLIVTVLDLGDEEAESGHQHGGGPLFGARAKGSNGMHALRLQLPHGQRQGHVVNHGQTMNGERGQGRKDVSECSCVIGSFSIVHLLDCHELPS